MATDITELRELVLTALRAGDLEGAYTYAHRLKDVEAREHPQRHHELFGVLRGVDHLKLVFSCKPQILKSVSEEALQHL